METESHSLPFNFYIFCPNAFKIEFRSKAILYIPNWQFCRFPFVVEPKTCAQIFIKMFVSNAAESQWKTAMMPST